MIAKRQNRFWRESSEGEWGDGAALLVGEKLQEQPEGVAIADARMRAEVALHRQVVGEKPLPQARKVIRLHGRLRPCSWKRRKELAAVARTVGSLVTSHPVDVKS